MATEFEFYQLVADTWFNGPIKMREKFIDAETATWPTVDLLRLGDIPDSGPRDESDRIVGGSLLNQAGLRMANDIIDTLGDCGVEKGQILEQSVSELRQMIEKRWPPDFTEV